MPRDPGSSHPVKSPTSRTRRPPLRGNVAMRFMDRVGGIPLVRAIGALRKRAMPGSLARIGVLRTAAIGDTLLLSGILRDLRGAFPGTDIVLVTGTENAEAGALAAHGSARHVRISVRDVVRAVATLRREQFDLLFDTGAWPRIDAVLTAMSGARYRIGFRTEGQYRHYGYDRFVDHSGAVHEMENYRALVRSIGITASEPPRIAADALPACPLGIGTPFVVFHPWASGYRYRLREWPADRWVALANGLRSRARLILVSGGQERMAESDVLARDLTSAGCDAESIAGRFSLSELAAVCVRSVGVVSTNTGVMHLAALLGIPTVGLHGPTDVRRWGPLGTRSRSVSSSFPGCGYLNLGFEYDGEREDCMRGISVSDVATAFLDAVSSTPTIS